MIECLAINTIYKFVCLQDYLYVSTQRTQHQGMLTLTFLNPSPSRRIFWSTTKRKQHQHVLIVPLLNLPRRKIFWKTPIGMLPEETTFTVYQNWLWYWVQWFSVFEKDVRVVYTNLQMLVQILNVNHETHLYPLQKMSWKMHGSAMHTFKQWRWHCIKTITLSIVLKNLNYI